MESRPYARGCLSRPSEPVLVVHHWDADGIAAAAVLAREWGPGAAERLVPEIGEYSVEAVLSRLRGYGGYPGVAVLDYGIAGGLPLLAAAVGASTVLYVDHHLVECGCTHCSCCNPLSVRWWLPEPWGGERDYPSAALLLSGLVGHSLDLGLVGLVGDVPGVVDRRRAEITRVLGAYGITVEELVEAVRNVDSCYVLFDYECIERAVETLAYRGVAEAAWEPRLAAARGKLQALLEDMMGRLESVAERRDGVVYAFLEGDALVYSKLGRYMATDIAGRDEVAVLAYYMAAKGTGVVYVRSVSRSVAWLIDWARSRGLNAGGKERVAVIHVRGPVERLSELAGHVVEMLARGVRGGSTGSR